jgi:deoxyribodipyrimidine photo-lyase
MLEMRHTGYMHNYMRMYWGKKILEWTSDPEEAWARTLRFNNRFLLDGRDPVSWGSVGWVFGLHDRPWPSRAVFGTVRSMTAGGLERKTDPRAYVLKVQGRLAGEAPPG